METRTYIAPSAKISRVVDLEIGDCYKRLDEGDSYREEKLTYGVVIDVLNNGEQMAIQAIEFETDLWNGAEAKHKVFKGGRELGLFPATPGEVQSYFESAVEKSQMKVEKAQGDLEKAFEHDQKLNAFLKGNLAGELREAKSVNQFKQIVESSEDE